MIWIIKMWYNNYESGYSMYFLMNKNNVVATFEKKPTTAFSDEVLFY